MQQIFSIVATWKFDSTPFLGGLDLSFRYVTFLFVCCGAGRLIRSLSQKNISCKSIYQMQIKAYWECVYIFNDALPYVAETFSFFLALIWRFHLKNAFLWWKGFRLVQQKVYFMFVLLKYVCYQHQCIINTAFIFCYLHNFSWRFYIDPIDFQEFFAGHIISGDFMKALKHSWLTNQHTSQELLLDALVLTLIYLVRGENT